MPFLGMHAQLGHCKYCQCQKLQEQTDRSTLFIWSYSNSLNYYIRDLTFHFKTHVLCIQSFQLLCIQSIQLLCSWLFCLFDAMFVSMCLRNYPSVYIMYVHVILGARTSGCCFGGTIWSWAFPAAPGSSESNGWCRKGQGSLPHTHSEVGDPVVWNLHI